MIYSANRQSKINKMADQLLIIPQNNQKSKKVEVIISLATTDNIDNIVYKDNKIKSIKNQVITIDGVVPKQQEVILVKNQILKHQNGIYVVKRNQDKEKPFSLIRNCCANDKDLIVVSNGLKNKDTKWICLNPDSSCDKEYLLYHDDDTLTCPPVEASNVNGPLPRGLRQSYPSNYIKLIPNVLRHRVTFEVGDKVTITLPGDYVVQLVPHDLGQSFVMNINGGIDATRYSGWLSAATDIIVFYLGKNMPNLGCSLIINKFTPDPEMYSSKKQ